jgi:hypothetical protein
MIELTHFCQISRSFPSEWRGESSDGRTVYVRYRHGILVGSIAKTLDDAVSYQLAALGLVVDRPKGTMLYNGYLHDRRSDGELDEVEMLALLAGEMRLAADCSREPYPYDDGVESLVVTAR